MQQRCSAILLHAYANAYMLTLRNPAVCCLLYHMCRAPPVAMAVGGGAYGVFLLMWLPLYLISFAVSAAGAWLVRVMSSLVYLLWYQKPVLLLSVYAQLSVSKVRLVCKQCLH
jgi:hypothetical protein